MGLTQLRMTRRSSYHSFLISYSLIFFVLNVVHPRTISCRRLYMKRASVAGFSSAAECIDIGFLPLRYPKVIEMVRILLPSGVVQTIVSLPTICMSRFGTGLCQISSRIKIKDGINTLTIFMEDSDVIHRLCCTCEPGSSIFQAIFD